MRNQTRVLINIDIRTTFNNTYRAYVQNGYQHIQALKMSRDDIIDVAEGEAKKLTQASGGFWNAMGQMANNAQALNNLDAQLNALIVENL